MKLKFDKEIPNPRERGVRSRRTIVFVHIKDETILEQLWERHNRPYQIWRPEVVRILKELGYKYKTIKWDQRAFCTCPCSPGFVVRGAVHPTEPGNPHLIYLETEDTMADLEIGAYI